MLAHGNNFTMRFITYLFAILIAIGALMYVANVGIGAQALPSLQEYMASTTLLYDTSHYRDAPHTSADWTASSTLVERLLSGTSSASTSLEATTSSAFLVETASTVRATVESSIKSSLSTPPRVTLTAVSPMITTLTAPRGSIKLILAKNPTTRERGLSGYTSLPSDTGMLFIFPKPELPDFWMKDMNFSIDIVWITQNRKVIAVTSDISPKTYPKTYAPPSSVQFVLELAAGNAKKLGLEAGTTVVF